MATNVILALLSGFLLGCGFVFYWFRRGLNAQEWLYFREFLLALRNGEYKELDDDERSDEDGE